tara:strand:+ start:8885 stop:9193 length:309 start_codon:yes stop_codon:yes gene_type:complete
MENLTPEQKNLLAFSEALQCFTGFFQRVFKSSHFQFVTLYKSVSEEKRDDLLKQVELFTFQERKVFLELLTKSHHQLGILIDRLQEFVENDKKKTDEKERQR